MHLGTSPHRRWSWTTLLFWGKLQAMQVFICTRVSLQYEKGTKQCRSRFYTLICQSFIFYTNLQMLNSDTNIWSRWKHEQESSQIDAKYNSKSCGKFIWLVDLIDIFKTQFNTKSSPSNIYFHPYVQFLHHFDNYQNTFLNQSVFFLTKTFVHKINFSSIQGWKFGQTLKLTSDIIISQNFCHIFFL